MKKSTKSKSDETRETTLQKMRSMIRLVIDHMVSFHLTILICTTKITKLYVKWSENTCMALWNQGTEKFDNLAQFIVTKYHANAPQSKRTRFASL